MLSLFSQSRHAFLLFSLLVGSGISCASSDSSEGIDSSDGGNEASGGESGSPGNTGGIGGKTNPFPGESGKGGASFPVGGDSSGGIAGQGVGGDQNSAGDNVGGTSGSSGQNGGETSGGSGPGGSGGCIPKCLGLQCGPDPVCGTSCGQCDTGTQCTTAGQCISNCTPNCGGRVCGPDPVCGTSCGQCGVGTQCTTAGQCISNCTPNCGGRVCGPDPVCGTSCGQCGAGTQCSSLGKCVSSCKPECGSRQCGPDPNGCGTSCGQCGAGTQCTPQGMCEPVCKTTWVTTVSGVDPIGQLKIVDKKAYAVGGKGTQAWMGSFSTCTGELTQEKSFAFSNSTFSLFRGLTFNNGSFHAVGRLTYNGQSGDKGLYANINTSLTLSASAPLYGSLKKDELYSAAVGTSGKIWLTGTADMSDSTGGGWVVKGLSPTQKFCGFPSGGKGNGSVRTMAVYGGKIWVAGEDENGGYLAGFSDTNCADEPCSCSPSTKATIKVGTVTTSLWGLITWKDSFYSVGFANDGAGVYGFAARISPSTFALEGVYRWDPTTGIDAFITLATDGSRLFLAGAQGWYGGENFNDASAAIVALPLAFSSNSIPDWSKVIKGSRIFMGIDVTSTDGVLLSAVAANGSGQVMRCTTDGQCP